jgi:arylsulfatase A-like enzyme
VALDEPQQHAARRRYQESDAAMHRMRKHRRVGWGVLFCALWISACSGGGDTGPPPHIILVIIDTIRADHMGLYGYEHPTTPRIDALAAQSVVFDNAIATCPATAPSIASTLTGHHRASHGVRRNGSLLHPSVTTLAEMLQSQGYRTAAVVSNPSIGRSGTGFDQGFDEFSFPPPIGQAIPGDPKPRFTGLAVVRDAERIIQQDDERPLFLWLHLMDPHGPYYPPAEYQELFDPEDYPAGPARLPTSKSDYGLGVLPRYQRIASEMIPGIVPKVIPARYRARYDAEIRYADDHVGTIIDALRAAGLWDHSIFVLTGDHGESLGEHDYFFQHGWFAYTSSLSVPLLIRAPGILPGGERVTSTLSLIDLAPTVLDLAGLAGGEEMEGRTLRPLVDGTERDRPAFAQTYYGNRVTALRQGPMNYILTPPPPPEDQPRHRDGWMPFWPTEGTEELYDLTTDPGETRNIIGERSGQASELRARLGRWLTDQEKRTKSLPHEPDRVRLDKTLTDQLRALGYVD